MVRGFLRRYGWQYLPGIAFLLLSAYSQTLAPRYLGQIIDELRLAVIDRKTVYRLVVWMLAAAVFTFVTRYVWRQLINGNGRNLEAYLRQILFAHFQKLDAHFFNRSKTGDLMAYAVNDINAVRQTFGPAVAMLINAASMTFMAVSNMVGGVDGRLAWFALTPVPFVVALMLFMGREVRRRFRGVQEAFASVSDRVQENISGLRVIKAYVQEEAEVARFETLNQNSHDASLAMVKVSSAMTPVVDLLFGVSFTVSLIYGSALVRQGAISLGDFVAFNGYLSMVVQPVRSVARIINVFSRGMASYRRLNALLGVLPMVGEGRKTAPGGANQAEISIKNLTFRYPGEERCALRNINFHLKPGKSLGILGRTGSGKTTLVNLLVKLYNAQEGTIRVGGIDIDEYSLDQLRYAIGYVPQDNFLFSASIEENIRFFSDRFTPGQIETAAKKAAIYDNIVEFPDGFHTEVGERGMSLSGGQKQRVCIARALIREPALLILDDSLSAVDTQTETAILGNLRAQTDRGGSLIIIAHRVSALVHCDEIIVLDEGMIVERGAHSELLARSGFYAAVARNQMEVESIESNEPKEGAEL